VPSWRATRALQLLPAPGAVAAPAPGPCRDTAPVAARTASKPGIPGQMRMPVDKGQGGRVWRASGADA